MSLWMMVWASVLHAEAPSQAGTEQVTAQLVASVDRVHAGDEIILGVQLRMIPHWHTYWRNPGDSGSATSIQWQLPDGATAGDILWPIPERSSLGPVTNYSYADTVTLPTKVQLPAQLPPGSQFNVTAKVEWLVCREECIPQEVELGLSLPVVAADQPSGSGSPLIADAMLRQPQPSPWAVSLHQQSLGQQTSSQQTTALSLHLAIPEDQRGKIQDMWFYPYDWGRINQSADQPRRLTPEGIELVLAPGEAPPEIDQAVAGVVVIRALTEAGEEVRGYVIEPKLAAVSASGASELSFLTAIALAFLGGLILNLMPCVLPVLSLKALSLVQQSGVAPRLIRLQGWAYTLGVVVSFVLLAILLISVKSAGAQIGWGFQFQSPVFVLVLAYLLFAVGLNLSGVLEVGGSVAGVGSGLANREGLSGSFFTGVLATLVATPCTAPFMAAALGYALAQPPLPLLAIFVSLAMGLASPYLLLSHWPNLQRWLPRPGLWMEKLKQFLAFPMYAAAIWLVWVLAQQAGELGVLWVLSGMLAIGFAAWLFTASRQAGHTTRYVSNAIAAFTVVVALVGSVNGLKDATPASGSSAAANNAVWLPYSPDNLQALLAEGKPVFVNFTAAWCISCLANEKVALSNARVKEAFNTRGITYLKGDWTNRDPTITAVLKQFGRSGVPLYLWYAPGAATPVELPQILTPDIILEVLEQPHAAVNKSD